MHSCVLHILALCLHVLLHICFFYYSGYMGSIVWTESAVWGRMQLVAPLWLGSMHLFRTSYPCALPACAFSYLLLMMLCNCNGHMGLIVWAESRGSRENAASSATGFNAPISYSLCFTWMRFLISAFYIWLLIAAVTWDWLFFVRMHSYCTL